MGNREYLISEIEDLLNPRPLLAIYFIKVGENQYMHKGNILTRKQCIDIPASSHHFIVPASEYFKNKSINKNG